MTQINTTTYGKGDSSFLAAGGEPGIRRLVNDFYDRMGFDARFHEIHTMHPSDLTLSRDKLATFLVGWLGGPRIYAEKYGGLSIPGAHQHLPITNAHREQWLCCMQESVAGQPFREDFKQYLMEQLALPAMAILRNCERIAAASK